jgi:TrmH family RNA methyltransferase
VLSGSEPLSPRNSRVKYLRELGRTRATRESDGVLLVEGAILIGEAVAAGWEVVEEFVGPGGQQVSSAPCSLVTEAALERVATTTGPQPNLAVVERRGTQFPVDANSVMVLDRLSDPGNVGTLIRSAEAAGLDAVVCTPGTADAFSPKAIRASAGAVFNVNVVNSTLDDVVSAGFTLIGTSSHRGVPYRTFDWNRKTAFVLGNEAHGVDESGLIGEWINIPQRGRTESLNVAMAGTLIAFAISDSASEPQ